MNSNKTKLVLGITAPQSVDLLNGQLRYFRECGFEVFLLAPKTDQVLAFCSKEGARLLPIEIKRNLNPFRDIMTLIQLYRVFRTVRPDIINLGTPKISLLGMLAARACSVPKRIYTCRGLRFEHEKGWFRKMLIQMERLIGHYAHQVVCISNSIKEIAQKERLFKPSKIVCIGSGSSNGVNLSIFNPEKIREHDKQAIKQLYELQDCFLFGFVGRLVDRKGIRELYAAFDRLYRHHKHVRLLVVGRPYWDQIKDASLLVQFDRHPGIVMAGLQPPESIPLFLSVMDVFVLPAWWEGFGNVLIQAAAMGIPVISTRATGCKDAVSDRFNGTLVPSRSVDALEQEMRSLMERKSTIQTYGRNGIIWAQQFNPEIIWKGLKTLYQA